MIKQLVLTLAKYMSPLFAILIPVVMLYGVIYPWPEANDALSKYQNEYILLIGGKSEYTQSYESHQNKYLILQPSILSSKTVLVTVDSTKKKEVVVAEGGFLSILIVYVVLLLLIWWFWFKPETHNKSLKAGTPQSGAP